MLCGVEAAHSHPLMDTHTLAFARFLVFALPLAPKARILCQIISPRDKSAFLPTDKTDLRVCEIIAEAWWQKFDAAVIYVGLSLPD